MKTYLLIGTVYCLYEGILQSWVFYNDESVFFVLISSNITHFSFQEVFEVRIGSDCFSFNCKTRLTNLFTRGFPINTPSLRTSRLFAAVTLIFWKSFIWSSLILDVWSLSAADFCFLHIENDKKRLNSQLVTFLKWLEMTLNFVSYWVFSDPLKTVLSTIVVTSNFFFVLMLL